MSDKPKDHPFDEVIAEVERQIAMGRICYQKFTCAGCGARLTIEEPNKFHTLGTCDKCPAVTDIKKQGCNYMLVATSRPDLLLKPDK